MKDEKKEDKFVKMGRRGMLKSFLAASATLSFGNIRGIEPASELSEIQNFNSELNRPPSKLKINSNSSLIIQPVLVYQISKRKEGTSWRTWSGLITEEHAAKEQARINTELNTMRNKIDFPINLLPLVSVQNIAEAESIAGRNHDGLIIYANKGPVYDTSLYKALVDPQKLNIVYLRHQTGPAYYYYCGVNHRLLRQLGDEFQGIGNLMVEDIVVDDYDEILWRLRTFHGLKNLRGKRIVCIGGTTGHSNGMYVAPKNARLLWDIDMIEVSYDTLSDKINAYYQNKKVVEKCKKKARQYMQKSGVELFPVQMELTTKELLAGKGVKETLGQMQTFVEKAFILKKVFIDFMNESETDAITVKGCMGPVINLAETTACLTLTLLNDSGYLAFCESDFVVIPACILLHYISGKPVFFGNPTFPHNNIVTVAHCSSPRKMDGQNLEPVKIRTYFESDYGAAPRVEMKQDQDLTVLIPDFNSHRWAGFEGTVLKNPEMDICTTQIDIGINGDNDQVKREIRGFHWPICYGNYLREVGYALSKTNIDWLNLSN